MTPPPQVPASLSPQHNPKTTSKNLQETLRHPPRLPPTPCLHTIRQKPSDPPHIQPSPPLQLSKPSLIRIYLHAKPPHPPPHFPAAQPPKQSKKILAQAVDFFFALLCPSAAFTQKMHSQLW
ncbi:hypothetical protein COCSADRAFT_31983 [Bipolaris sorokiniana ND90Pr]|uniref:Uncharacterized protein n=1 Tax=Cochliobolus sativus (strain ND90Pr / ATCC 201652) TaxID=665912 RepID=M2TJ56_COCSN|nr:uncharacterized protein COCSADRAFT_31983 [Bipolaris sorokiniana ND90Pr]EMD69241.1 hypothetical protein COCSADRAFT_31983 [Bipolaris sorokiniana ND90Pr]